MTAIEAFDEFWMIIRRNEDYLKTYGQHHCHDWEERSHPDLIEAYRQVQKYLHTVSRHQMLDAPDNIDRFSAHNYHEALIEVLNPPERWFRQLWVLNAPEYLALKAGARADEQTVIGTEVETSGRKHPAHRTRPKKKRRKEAMEKKLFNKPTEAVFSVLLQDHGCNSGNPMNKPLKQPEIEQRLIEENIPFSQPTISRAMKDLMSLVPMYGHLMGMEKYEMLCGKSQICDALSSLQVRSNKYLERGLHDRFERLDENIQLHHDRGY